MTLNVLYYVKWNISCHMFIKTRMKQPSETSGLQMCISEPGGPPKERTMPAMKQLLAEELKAVTVISRYIPPM